MISRKYAELLCLLFLLVAFVGLYRFATPERTVQTALGLSEEQNASAEGASEKTGRQEATPVKHGAEDAAQIDAFGIDTSQFRAAPAQRVQRNETFAEILTAHGVSYAEITRIARQAAPDFEVRRLGVGKSYRIYEDAEQGRPRYFVYQPDAIHYTVLDLGRDSARVRSGERTVQLVRREASGAIRSSLYDTLSEADVDPELAFDLSEVFAWQIDFYRIRKGDRFRVVYEEKQIDGQPVGLGKILAARFTHRGEPFYGIYFEQDGQGDYFDEDGESLRKALLKAPLRYRRISSRYTKRRFHPIQKRYKAHLGTDYAAAPGTPVRSVGDGTVLKAGYSRYNGHWVKVRHNAKYTTGYLHFSKIADGIKSGAKVEQGQVIGYVGSTGLATGPHLCYRFWKNGRQVDPLKEEMPSSDPVEERYLAAYNGTKRALLPLVQPGGPSLADSTPDDDLFFPPPRAPFAFSSFSVLTP